MIGIVDYGLGNVRSVQGALEFLGASSTISHGAEVLLGCDKLILPGVGSFHEAMVNMNNAGLATIVKRFACEYRRPLLGICLGMQLFADFGEEDGVTPGLGLVPGRVRHFPELGLPVPHVGFNTAEFVKTPLSLFGGLGSKAEFYFVHSYRFEVAEVDDVTSWCDYGVPFAASLQRGLIYGTQFHPEKSQTNGLRVLKNFVQLST